MNVMRCYFLGLATLTCGWLALSGCGDTTDGSPAGGAGSVGDAAGSSGAGAGASLAGNASGGTNGAGTNGSGGSKAGSSAGGAEPGAAGSSDEPAEGGEGPGDGAGGGGPAGGLVNCDARDALCKLLPEPCPAMQVREVVGTCWGECIEIDQCACGSANDCPNSNEYTCWMGTHCGPYVK
jgi:hypothetical protein